MAKEIFPYMEAYLTGLAQRGELQTKNPYLLARFIWGGQMEVMNEETISLSDRIAFLNNKTIECVGKPEEVFSNKSVIYTFGLELNKKIDKIGRGGMR